MPEPTAPFEADWEITPEMIHAFGTITGADARIHWDAEYARGTRFGGVVAPGMLVTGLLDAWLTRLGLGWPAHGELETRYVAPVRPGDRLVARLSPIEGASATGPLQFGIEGRVGEALVLRGHYRPGAESG